MLNNRPDWLDKPQTEWPYNFRHVHQMLSEDVGRPVSPDDVFRWMTEDDVLREYLVLKGTAAPSDSDLNTIRQEILSKLVG